MAGGPVHDGLYSLHIGLPGPVGTSVGVAHLDTEGNALFAKFALSHLSHLLAGGFADIFQKSSLNLCCYISAYHEYLLL